MVSDVVTYRRDTITASDIRRQTFLNDREWRRTAVGDDIALRVAHVRRHFHCFPPHKSRDFHLNITDYIEINDETKRKVGKFLERTAVEPLSLPQSSLVTDEKLPSVGTDVDFSQIEAHILAASNLSHNVRRKHRRWTRKRVIEQHKSYCVPPLYEEMEEPSAWTLEVEDVYRFRAAGYRDETHFRVVNGPSIPSKKWR